MGGLPLLYLEDGTPVNMSSGKRTHRSMHWQNEWCLYGHLDGYLDGQRLGYYGAQMQGTVASLDTD